MEIKEKQPFISVVMIAHKKVGLLSQAIQSIQREVAEKNWELLLVRNGDNQEMLAFTNALALSADFPVKIISIPEQRPGAARNHAVLHAKGEVVFFLDDDIILFQDIFSVAKEIFADPSVMAAGGANLNPPNSGNFEVASGQAMASYWGTASMSARYRASQEDRLANEHDLILCNLAVRRSVLHPAEKIFPPHFVSNEENIFLQSLEQAGIKMIASPGLAVYHQRRNTWTGLAQQCFKYGHGRAQNCLHVPDSFQFLYLVPSLFLGMLFLLGIFSILYSNPWIFFGPFFLYTFFCLGFSLRDFIFTKKWQAFLLQVPIYLLIHASYGVGFWNGFFGWAWRREKLSEAITSEH